MKNGTTSSGYVGGPLVGRRLSDVKERRAFEERQKAANTPSAVETYWEGVEARRKAQQQEWDDAEQQRRDEADARERETIEHNARVIAARDAAAKAKAEQATFTILRNSMYEKLNATESEIARIELLVERNHKDTKDDVNLREVLLLKLRAILG